jgi:hypothetical protein
MKTNVRKPATKRARAVVTTIGELISAAYEAAPGFGRRRAERALVLLTRSPLARSLHPHVVFTR